MKKPPQTLNGVIRERLEDIEKRLAFGVRQEVILDELRTLGYETTIDTLRNALWRARKWRQRQAAASHPTDTPNQPPAPAVNTAAPQPKPPENPLKKPRGFRYSGKATDDNDLV